MTITLPDELRETLESRAKAAGFDRVDDFVEDVVSGDIDLMRICDPGVQSRMKELVEEAIASGPAIPVDAEFWERLETRVTERLAVEAAAK